jgi:tRNA pseudouridine55 synthase
MSLGRATRLFRFAGGPDKAYRAEVVFGITTDTLDVEGRVLERTDSTALGQANVRELLQDFVGEVEQAPPAFSASHVGGQRLHELARRGEALTGRPRKVTISQLDLVAFEPGQAARATVDVVCETGTYVRVLARDLGLAAGCGAYLAFLVRTRAGPFDLSQALTIEEFEDACEQSEWESLLLPLDWPLARFPAVELPNQEARAFVHGTNVRAAAPSSWPVRVYGPGGSFLGLGDILAEGHLKPRVVLAAGEQWP